MSTASDAFSATALLSTRIEEWAAHVTADASDEPSSNEVTVLDLAKIQIDECTSVLKGLQRSEPSQQGKIDNLLSNLQLWVQSFSESDRASIWREAEDLERTVLTILDKIFDSLSKGVRHRE